MRNSKLVHFLTQLSGSERKEFDEFLNSPFHNKHKDSIKLFRLIEKNILITRKRNLSEEEMFALLLPGVTYNINRFRKLKNKVLNLLFKYYTLKQLEFQPGKQNALLLRELNARGENRYFEKYYRDARTMIQGNQLLPEDSMDSALEIEHERARNLAQNSVRTGKYNLNNFNWQPYWRAWFLR